MIPPQYPTSMSATISYRADTQRAEPNLTLGYTAPAKSALYPGGAIPPGQSKEEETTT